MCITFWGFWQKIKAFHGHSTSLPLEHFPVGFFPSLKTPPLPKDKHFSISVHGFSNYCASSDDILKHRG